jgi:hypothetical protein
MGAGNQPLRRFNMRGAVLMGRMIGLHNGPHQFFLSVDTLKRNAQVFACYAPVPRLLFTSYRMTGESASCL